MTNFEELVASLHPLERKVLPFVEKNPVVPAICKAANMQEVEVVRGLQWLGQKNLILLEQKKQDWISLGENGKRFATEGLPEKKILALLDKKPTPIPGIAREAALSDQEANACIGLLKKRQWVKNDEKNPAALALSPIGQKALKAQLPEEKFLTMPFPVSLDVLKQEDKDLIQELKKRKDVLLVETKTQFSAKLTDAGKAVLARGMHTEFIDAITPEMLANGSWKGKQFRRFDVTSPVPPLNGGRKHFVTEAVEYARQIWLDMGFEEMNGNLIQPSFWNFDALFSAQDHPVREMQDTFFVKEPALAKAPHKDIVEKIKRMHEKGEPCGSKAWGGTWTIDEARKNVLRTHTTVLSARTLASVDPASLPRKFFSLGKCFRNEALDWKHLFEFNQTDGMVIDKDGSFCNLLGYLQQFFAKMGFPKARFRPAYFPYTEPSVEIDVYHPKRQTWIELGGAGMARPEVAVPLLGADIPILLWGPGFDRIILDYYKITDIRDLYKNDLGQSRSFKAWLGTHAND